MKKGRPKKQKVNNQPIAQELLIEDIKHDYLFPSADTADQSGRAKLSYLCDKYNLSNLKLRKLLITACIYDSPQYRAVRDLQLEGLTD